MILPVKHNQLDTDIMDNQSSTIYFEPGADHEVSAPVESMHGTPRDGSPPRRDSKRASAK